MNSSQITHLTGWSNYTRVHYADGSVVIKARTIKALCSQPDLSGFIRIHNQTAVNPDYIGGIEKSNRAPFRSYCNLVTTPTLFPIARRRVEEVQTKYLVHRQSKDSSKRLCELIKQPGHVS